MDEGPARRISTLRCDDRRHGARLQAEVWDDAEFCPDCGEQIGGRTSARRPVERELRQRWFVLVVILVLIGFLCWLTRLF